MATVAAPAVALLPLLDTLRPPITTRLLFPTDSTALSAPAAAATVATIAPAAVVIAGRLGFAFSTEKE